MGPVNKKLEQLFGVDNGKNLVYHRMENEFFRKFCRLMYKRYGVVVLMTPNPITKNDERLTPLEHNQKHWTHIRFVQQLPHELFNFKRADKIDLSAFGYLVDTIVMSTVISLLENDRIYRDTELWMSVPQYDRDGHSMLVSFAANPQEYAVYAGTPNYDSSTVETRKKQDHFSEGMSKFVNSLGYQFNERLNQRGTGDWNMDWVPDCSLKFKLSDLPRRSDTVYLNFNWPGLARMVSEPLSRETIAGIMARRFDHVLWRYIDKKEASEFDYRIEHILFIKGTGVVVVVNWQQTDIV